jgi:hypothetical protein
MQIKQQRGILKNRTVEGFRDEVTSGAPTMTSSFDPARV